MRRSSHLLMLAAAAAMGGYTPPFLRPIQSGGFNVPRYNQRKSRKLARSTGIHPANAKRLTR